MIGDRMATHVQIKITETTPNRVGSGIMAFDMFCLKAQFEHN